jgi:hypothetical protein
VNIKQEYGLKHQYFWAAYSSVSSSTECPKLLDVRISLVYTVRFCKIIWIATPPRAVEVFHDDD